MLKTTLIGLAAFLIGAAGLSPARAQQLTGLPSAQPAAAPKAVVPFTSYDFGNVHRGEIIGHIFVIRNGGEADLVIKDFAAG